MAAPVTPDDEVVQMASSYPIPSIVDSSSEEEEDDEPAHDLDQFPDEEEPFKDSWWKKIARFLFSFVGLFLLLAGYSVGGKLRLIQCKPIENRKTEPAFSAGAFFFLHGEDVAELEGLRTMCEEARKVNVSIDFITDHLTSVAFDPGYTYNNCTVFTDDPFFTNGSYSDICIDEFNPKVIASRFCQCVWTYRNRFKTDVRYYRVVMKHHVHSQCVAGNGKPGAHDQVYRDHL
jgi:hypothetical protein